jgi:putative ABC transport system substrate-binding protein
MRTLDRLQGDIRRVEILHCGEPLTWGSAIRYASPWLVAAGAIGQMKRRQFLTVLGGAAAWPLAARAQQPTIPVIGFLTTTSPDWRFGERLRKFSQGLKEQGFVEGENVAILYRFADDQADRLPELMADLVRRKVAVIVTGGPPATFAAQAATSTIPITFVVADDPVRLGLAVSLSRPGSNMTGINVLNAEVAAKRLELLRDLVPSVTRIAVFVNPVDAAMMETQMRDVHTAAHAMGLHIQTFDANTSAEIDSAFKAFGRERADALFVPTSPFFNGRRVQLAQLAAFHHLPATYALRDYTEVGGLMSYGSNIADGYRQVGNYVGRVLKGAKPADLPIVQANKFELVINMQTARMLDIAVPSSLIAIADELIE